MRFRLHPEDMQIGDLPKGIAEVMRSSGKSACCGVTLVPGPKGGLAQNHWCSKCHVRFNLTMVPALGWGQIVVLPPDPDFEELSKRRYD